MKPDQYRIIANGEERWIRKPCSVAGFLETCGWKATQVVVERNGRVLERSELGVTQLEADDRLEIIVPVAGG